MYLIASVCFCASENCWAKLSTASPKRPVCDIGTFRNCTFSCSFMSVRHSPRWRSWATSVDIALPRDCAVTFVARSARCTQDAAHVEPPGHDHPRAGLSVLWPDGPAVTPWHVGQKPHPHRLYKHCQLGLTNIYRPMRGDTVHPAEWKQLLNIVAWPKTAPQKGYLCTPKRLRHQGWWGGRGVTRFVSGSERCLSRSCKFLMHFRKEWHRRGFSARPHRETNHDCMPMSIGSFSYTRSG